MAAVAAFVAIGRDIVSAGQIVEFADSLLAASSWSFPSAHAMNTFVFFGLGAYLLVRSVRSWKMASLAVTVAIVWCLVMGFSRMYLGVHFASDVVGHRVGGDLRFRDGNSALALAHPDQPLTGPYRGWPGPLAVQYSRRRA